MPSHMDKFSLPDWTLMCIMTAFFISALLLRVPQIANFGMVGCRQIFLVSKGAVNLKRLKNTALDNRTFINSVASF